MQSHLSVGTLFEHASSAGHATERDWIHLFTRYLPKRYTAAPAFVIDHKGRRSRQIDIAIFDNLYTPPLFPHDSGIHIPAESVYAVFEVKPTISKQWLRDAGEKAASVRALKRTSVPVIANGITRRPTSPKPILAGLLATSSVWTPESFAENLRKSLRGQTGDHRIDLGCALNHGAFEKNRTIKVSAATESLIFLIIRLIDRLREQGTAPAPDLMKYLRSSALICGPISE